MQLTDVTMGPAEYVGAHQVTGKVTIVNNGPSAWTIVTDGLLGLQRVTRPRVDCDRLTCRLDGLPVGTSSEREC